MKKIIYVAIIALGITSCKKEANDFVTFSGKIENKNSNTLTVFNPQLGFKKTINVAEDGTFKDTLKVKDGLFFLSDGKERTNLYLKNGYAINMTINTKQFDETVRYSGKGAEESNLLAKIGLAKESLMMDKTLFSLSQADFETKTNSVVSKIEEDLKNKTLDSSFVSQQKKGLDGLKSYLSQNFKDKQYILNVLGKGKASPKFTNYENFKGGTTSLDDLKGKYVYIDVWATWCNPCKQEIPSLQNIEKKYHDKNIEFVSISIDDKKGYDAWKTMVTDKKLGGIQLYADNSWNSEFAKQYLIKGIPRFVLIDPNGNIVSAQAPRPSQPELVTLLDSLKL